MNTQLISLPLPSKLSDLLELAVNDAQKAAKMPGVELDMTYWQVGANAVNKTCKVCMAGAVLLCEKATNVTTDAPHYKNLMDIADGPTVIAMCRIDAARKGAVLAATAFNTGFNEPHMGTQFSTYDCLKPIREDYKIDQQRASWKAYRQAIRRLRRNGL